MKKISSKTSKKTKNIKKIIKKSSVKHIIPKTTKKKKIALKKEPMPQAPVYSFQAQKESVEIEKVKFTAVQEPIADNNRYSLPLRYADNRITILPRDPWWIHTYWDISEQRINEVISSIPVYERENLKWILRIYDLTGINHFDGKNANSFFDIVIHFEANNWYINVNQPERSWCVEIGLINPSGKFFMVARSNVIKTPYFGISSIIDEEWALPDEDYYKVLGIYDLGRSSLERKRRFEEIIKNQISSPLASWGVSSLFSERAKEADKFFLEVWTELILYGRTEPGADVTVEGKKVTLKPDGTFSIRYALPVGDYQYKVVGVSKNKKHKVTKTPAVKRFEK
ncbi:MAG: DUF4912 domain-containing protein [Candidatus Omnitrophica bacterium]|nr:DUF4912 domain-containing protein [Candidatus Omnitrophota bacterium]